MKAPGDVGQYSNARIQCIEYIESLSAAYGIGFHEGCAIKYISRWRAKNGIDDLLKAIWYIERLICAAVCDGEMPDPSDIDGMRQIVDEQRAKK